MLGIKRTIQKLDVGQRVRLVKPLFFKKAEIGKEGVIICYASTMLVPEGYQIHWNNEDIPCQFGYGDSEIIPILSTNRNMVYLLKKA